MVDQYKTQQKFSPRYSVAVASRPEYLATRSSFAGSIGQSPTALIKRRKSPPVNLKLGIPENERIRLANALAYKGLKSKLFGGCTNTTRQAQELND